MDEFAFLVVSMTGASLVMIVASLVTLQSASRSSTTVDPVVPAPVLSPAGIQGLNNLAHMPP